MAPRSWVALEGTPGKAYEARGWELWAPLAPLYQAGEYAEELAAEMLATTLNVEFDPDKSWDEKKEMYRISNKIVRTTNITQSAIGDKRGLWTTVIAAAILIFE